MKKYVPLFEEYISSLNESNKMNHRETPSKRNRWHNEDSRKLDDEYFDVNAYKNRSSNDFQDDDEFDYGKLYKRHHSRPDYEISGDSAAISADGSHYEDYSRSPYRERVTKTTLADYMAKESIDVLEQGIEVIDNNGDSVMLSAAEILLVILTIGAVLYFGDDGAIHATIDSISDAVNQIFGK